MKPRLKVIVAEDNPVQRAYFTKLIEKLGYEALPAEDGLVALQLIRETDAQILLSDYQMPNLNGLDLARRVRKLDLDYYVYIIIVTGSADTEEDFLLNNALEAGVDDFLAKSGSPFRLQARIRTASRVINHAIELAERTRILKDSIDHIQADLNAAAEAQRQLLPDIHEKMLGFRISSAFVPSSFVSGDMFGCFPISDTKLGFYAVDVSGHGVHASLLSVAIGHLVTPEFFITKVLGKDCNPDPAALVADLNSRFSGRNSDDYFSMFCGVVDTNTGHLDYCQAGSPFPYHVDQFGKTEAIGDGGFPVGMFHEATFENSHMEMAAGSAFVVCSDAATEAENIKNEPFGEERLEAIVAKTPDLGAEKIPAAIIHALTVWRDGRTLADDLTIVVIERTIPHDF